MEQVACHLQKALIIKGIDLPAFKSVKFSDITFEALEQNATTLECSQQSRGGR
jgi:hypothetical protein